MGFHVSTSLTLTNSRTQQPRAVTLATGECSERFSFTRIFVRQQLRKMSRKLVIVTPDKDVKEEFHATELCLDNSVIVLQSSLHPVLHRLDSKGDFCASPHSSLNLLRSMLTKPSCKTNKNPERMQKYSQKVADVPRTPCTKRDHHF